MAPSSSSSSIGAGVGDAEGKIVSSGLVLAHAELVQGPPAHFVMPMHSVLAHVAHVYDDGHISQQLAHGVADDPVSPGSPPVPHM